MESGRWELLLIDICMVLREFKLWDLPADALVCMGVTCESPENDKEVSGVEREGG